MRLALQAKVGPTFVVVLSRRSVAIVTILLGLAAAAASGLYPGDRFFSTFASCAPNSTTECQ
jgi:hypothetical protein